MRKLLLFFILIISQLYYSQSDCITAIPICGNSDISYNSDTNGNVIEQTSGSCLGMENHSVWYVFTAATTGTIEFTINPDTVPGTTHYDYDFAVYGPNINCATWDFGDAIRCNYSGTSGATGLSSTQTGSQWSPALPVIAGEVYYLLIDNFIPANLLGFSLTWGGTSTLTSAFNNPALAPNPFITPGVPNATNPALPNEILKCNLPTQFDFTTLTTDILNGNPNFTVTYHNVNNDAITGANPLTTTTVDGTTLYYYRIKYIDPANPSNPANGCFQTGKFKFRQGNIVPKNATIKACNNNGAGTGTFNLNTADVFDDATAIKKYYLTLADLNAGINQITNPTAYVSAPKTIYVKVSSLEGCTAYSTITLEFFPVVVVTPASLESCFIEGAITTASFDLTQATVTAQSGNTKRFFTTMANALAGTNEIIPANNYITTSTDVYVRVTNNDGCYAITKITLKVIPPVKSTVLKDKTICFEDKTTLDAGSGFSEYEWSTGATTQVISNVGVGAYWVKLKTGKCFTLQQVHVYASQQPVIASIDITNNTITVNASGGSAPYQYSLDGSNWQDSNVFTGLPRGENKIFVKDSFDCNPIQIQVTVPNLVNAITPNGDNVNDEVDYSALAYKKNLLFVVYNRYGNKIYEADKIRNFKWNGTSGGKKIPTGTYWYTITWNENDKNSTPTKYDGWVLVKNRE
ncbi:gliding motility-associated C-terminal domain-containing protein [Chryseobacterium sp. Ch-15]|uniref:Gliding motility-associated C-terminal domain-containing protein n=1 Tax=Chryseobacterium muglaense TaxID=2893752 RepID=A0A9Q3UV43_9FLAO|nr:gliding motility-associated C-terminal domain-containing protein [Chryseobacterium muglaense]MBD3903858.1 gliding motility-associated C-terminal domain-containing protein [Chryseobacterium muglaense]MCC9034932.1 gliding motility-associated C-terminal domain-containing protein [Chryseobacterium muglaense]MCM2553199.1 gliding motility-associated C-terminal domain-containing protein [Chryseobacterium muglaense]